LESFLWSQLIPELLGKNEMKVLEEKTNLRRLLEASEKGDVAAARELLESGNVDVNGVDDKVRLLSSLRQTAAWPLCGNGRTSWCCGCGMCCLG
jgi:hypothetical protein